MAKKKRGTRARPSKQSGGTETVKFLRGGREVSLIKSDNIIAVRYRDGSIPDQLSAVLANTDVPHNIRRVRKLPGRRVALYHCPAESRDSVMDSLRQHKDQIQYCSHVLKRLADDLPGMEITIDDRIFAEFEDSPSRELISELESEHGIRTIWRFPEHPGGIVFEVTADALDNPIKISHKLTRQAGCRGAEPCLIDVKAARAVPSDAAFNSQWHLLNTGQNGGVAGADCNAPSAWDYSWGDSAITVAVIDDGFDLGHPDLGAAQKVRDPYDATGRDTNPSPESFGDNHGTACAGVAIAARGGEGLAVGVAPGCSWMPIRHAGELGDFEEALAFYHAYTNKADIISCSWGPWDAYQNALWPMPSLTRWVIDLCAQRGRNSLGIAIFFAAGNGNEPLALDGYANYENVIAVAASTNEDLKAPYSDYGENVWVCAPSSGGTQGIFTTDRRGVDGYNAMADYTSNFGGTSSSTPLVAGVAALMLSVNPNLTVLEIKGILKRTAVAINRDDTKNYTDHWGGNYTDAYDDDGHSQVFGWGRVDAGAAVAEAFRLRRTDNWPNRSGFSGREFLA